ncbi:MAG: tetratricopeptide repeat protein [Proteobacteria bacterium]|nr:tetratricopeptide repeat protein [Pseudomonadota bacterium]
MKRIRAAAFMTGVLILGLMLTGCAQILRTRGEIAMASNNYEAAIGHFQESLIKNPDDHETRARLGFAHFKAGRTDQAIEILREVLLKKADEPSASLYLGMALLKRGERGAAMAAWRNYRNPAQPIVNKRSRNSSPCWRWWKAANLRKRPWRMRKNCRRLRQNPGRSA